MTEAKIVIIDDNDAVLKTLKIVLSNEFATVVTVNNPQLIPALLQAGDTDLVLLDMNFGNGNLNGQQGLFWLDRIKNNSCTLPPSVVLITAFGDIDLAVKSLKNGADDFVQKPWDNERLIHILHEALRKRKEKQQDNAVKEENDEQSACEIILNSLLKKYATAYAKPLPALSKQTHDLLLELCLQGDLNRVQEAVERTILLLNAPVWNVNDLIMPQREESENKFTLEDLERKFIASVLKETNRNLQIAAQQLGISRQTLYNKMNKYGLD